MDGWSNYIPVIVLGIVACVALVCATVLAARDPAAVNSIAAVGGAAVGAIAGLSRDHSPPTTTPQS